MKNTKTSEFTFSSEGKESISTRLRKLIGERSVRAAAQAWGLSFSTLNNYLTRGTEPSLNVAIKISHVENVSIEWLATGLEDPSEQEKIDSAPPSDAKLKNTWLMIFDSLDSSEIQQLIKAIHKKGVDGIVGAAAQTTDSANLEFLNLSKDEKERLIRLYEQVKKGSPEDGARAEPESLTTGQKKAG